ncbi:MAG TPA: hypothetical protein VFE20_02375 [Thermoleophilia bacterium]|nr:hypothetical protein [Thermoleophilia bacterium]
MVDVLETFLPSEVREFVEYREVSIKTAEGVALFDERQGRVIPTLCIAGRKVCESMIPTLDELYGFLLEAALTQEQTMALEEARERMLREYMG